MTDAPERIWAGPDEEDGWRWPAASKFPDPPRRTVEYIRADTVSRLIAEAVVAERERCARLCEENIMATPYHGEKPIFAGYIMDTVDYKTALMHHGRGYAAAIRKGE